MGQPWNAGRPRGGRRDDPHPGPPYAGAVTFLRALVMLMRLRGFRRLLFARVTSQASDGIFQVALAGHVLFNPEQATDARGIAAAFAALLLPYSLVGPFAGVLLDRRPRRRVIVVSQMARMALMVPVSLLVVQAQVSLLFIVVVLLTFSVNRFVLTGLSAALPHVVERDQLVSANSVAPTVGSFAYVLGGALGTAILAASSDLVVVLAAAVGVGMGAFAAALLPFVGPDDTVPMPLAAVVRSVLAGFVEAARTIPRRARVLLALIIATRIPMGFLLLQSVLLFRGPFASTSVGPVSGVGGLGIAVAASAAGFALAAFVTPWLSPKLQPVPFATAALALAAVACAAVGWVLAPWSFVVIGFLVAFSSQCVKITVDSLLQAHVLDVLLGRAFAFYDVAYNAGLVAGAAIAAVVLPGSALAPWALFAIAAFYVALSGTFGPAWQRASARDASRPLG